MATAHFSSIKGVFTCIPSALEQPVLQKCHPNQTVCLDRRRCSPTDRRLRTFIRAASPGDIFREEDEEEYEFEAEEASVGVGSSSCFSMPPSIAFIRATRPADTLPDTPGDFEGEVGTAEGEDAVSSLLVLKLPVEDELPILIPCIREANPADTRGDPPAVVCELELLEVFF